MTRTVTGGSTPPDLLRTPLPCCARSSLFVASAVRRQPVGTGSAQIRWHRREQAAGQMALCQKQPETASSTTRVSPTAHPSSPPALTSASQRLKASWRILSRMRLGDYRRVVVHRDVRHLRSSGTHGPR